MNELQREANRDFTPTIASIMQAVYDLCANESGIGCYMRMKVHMKQQVDQNRHIMFHNATKTVKQHLDDMCKQLEEVMEARADEIYVKMKADYMRVLGGVQINQANVMPKEGRALRTEVYDILRTVDDQFAPIVRGEVTEQNDVEGAVEEPVAIEDEDEKGIFESAYETPGRDENGNSIMADVDETITTGITPSKPLEISNDKENRGLPTPSDDGMEMQGEEL